MSTAPTGSVHGPVPPLGVHVVDGGVQVAVLASHATGVDLCLVDPAPAPGSSPDVRWTERRIPLVEHSYGVWHGFVPGVTEGQRYGFRTHGPWDPRAGQRHNPAKLLVDPYARGIVGDLGHGPETYGHVTTRGDDGSVSGDPYGPADDRDSLEHVPHSVVVAPRQGHPPVRRPGVARRATVIYEAHVRGLTQNLETVPEHLRGTYAGLAHPETIRHLTDLGVTTLELLPVHAFTTEPHLVDKGLTNYWGYNTLGFFAPHPGYATRQAQDAGPGAVLDEVRGMVHLLHEAGIEVILDVVYNHTCEGGVPGQHLSWRGLDSSVYYLHEHGAPGALVDVTGCGNSLDFRHPRVVQMTLDSLRYWAQEVGVDGFRFDLAVTLGRDSTGFTANHPFLVALQTDPVLNGLKLVAEPWDVGMGGWQTGHFPAPMAEWNDRFRNATRSFWLSDPAQAAHGRPGHGIRDLATRLAGSADLFGHSDPPLVRGPVASINYVTAHDGFTMADLVAYEHKHNLANGENGRDGSNDNRSWNHGIEGPVPFDSVGMEIAPLRRRSVRNLMGMLLLSAGTPMITAGDEMGRTQRGNNNAYCQDNDLSYVRWDLSPWRKDLLDTTRYLLALRREHPALHVDEFFLGRPQEHDAPSQPDLAWYGAGGEPVTHDEWHDPAVRIVQMLRRGRITGKEDAHDPHVLLVVNGTLDGAEVTLAGQGNSSRDWALVWDSAWENPSELGAHVAVDEPDPEDVTAGETVALEPLSMQVYVAHCSEGPTAPTQV
ncbi:glycogen debranching protein GlgX [Sanguibacter suaedae]|uniref:Glycogen debranching protein GlgX n=1 Tax=Sanguibacter suaedae TaxID=2795737 RepID=A0A934IAG9_9MICO|nr:glycogen debranching protein GlgX [Sanguibacter suaedae]MBI9116072.1 glycogen debranching protein GlgX [Sanguibacter suaedae]